MAENYFIFRYANEQLAVPAASTRQVVTLNDLKPLPSTAGFLFGLSPAGGEVLPVANLAKVLEIETAAFLYPKTEEGTQLGVVVSEQEKIILPLDEVVGFASIDETAIFDAVVGHETNFGPYNARPLSLAALLSHLSSRLVLV